MYSFIVAIVTGNGGGDVGFYRFCGFEIAVVQAKYNSNGNKIPLHTRTQSNQTKNQRQLFVFISQTAMEENTINEIAGNLLHEIERHA